MCLCAELLRAREKTRDPDLGINQGIANPGLGYKETVPRDRGPGHKCQAK